MNQEITLEYAKKVQKNAEWAYNNAMGKFYYSMLEIADDVRKDLNLHDIYKQVDQHIMNYATAAGVDNKSHWIEPNLPDLDRDLKEEVEIDFE